MRRDAGVVLVNALVIVLAISAVAAALLTRSEAARVRAGYAQASHQLALYLDGIEALVPDLLDEVRDSGLSNRDQAWAQGTRQYPIDRGSVAVEVVDLQGRLNVNWLTRADDYTEEVFREVFQQLRVPLPLLAEITDYVSAGGPRGAAAYLARRPSVLPRGGSVTMLDDLREVQGMTPQYFDVLAKVLSALPADARLNINTAPRLVLEAALRPLPSELVAEILNRDTPVNAMAELRQRAMEILETEDIDDLQLERLTVGSTWFLATLAAELDGKTQRRRAVFLVEPATELSIRRQSRWAVYD